MTFPNDLEDEPRDSDEYEPALTEGSRLIPTIHLATGVEGAPVRQVIAMLGKLDGVYQQHGRLVHIVKPDAPADLDNTCLSEPRVQEIHSAWLRNIISDAFRFTKPAPANLGGGEQAAACPEWLTQAVLHCGEWRGVKPLTGIVSWPCMRKDGTFITRPGYDHASGLVYRGEPITVPECPTPETAREALACLLDIVKHFPFRHESHRSAWLALPLALVARHAFELAPLWIFDAPTPGSGKTLLAEIATMLVTGRKPSMLTPTDDDDENRKRITSMVLDSVPSCVIDNVAGHFGGPSWDKVITQGQWDDRLLGQNKNMRDICKVVWAVTGNNVTVKGDMYRRTLPCVIDPKMERPDRRPLSQDALKEQIVTRHREYLEAIVTLLKFGVVHPPVEMKTWGSFDGFSRTVRQALIAVGQTDPYLAQDGFTETADMDRETRVGLLQALRRTTLISGAMRARDLLKAIDADTKEMLGDMCRCKDKDLTASRIGYFFRKIKDRNIDGLRLTCELDRDGVATWSVEQATVEHKAAE